MLSSLVALLAALLLLYNPIIQLLSPAPPRMRRAPRPQLNEELLALEEDGGGGGNMTCPGDAYSVHIMSKEPLVLYVENFLSSAERAHLLDISEPLFQPSTVTHNGGAATHRDQTVRDSEVAVIPRTNIVRCIEARARALQGWRSEQWIERLRTQRYGPGGHYSHHFDWSSSWGGWGRVSTFMVWVDGSADEALVGGGTEFPRLRPLSRDGRLCRFVDCDTVGGEEGKEAAGRPVEAGGDDVGVVFKPMAGNAVYWENFRPDGTGRGWDETWHAGLPVVHGRKVGLNIWTWGRID